MKNKDFTDKLSAMDINNNDGIKKLFNDYGVSLSDKQVSKGIKNH